MKDLLRDFVVTMTLVSFCGLLGCGGMSDFSDSSKQLENQEISENSVVTFAGYDGPRGTIHFSAENNRLKSSQNAPELKSWKLKIWRLESYESIVHRDPDEVWGLDSGVGSVSVPLGTIQLQITQRPGRFSSMDMNLLKSVLTSRMKMLS